MPILPVAVVVRSAYASWRLRDKQAVSPHKIVLAKPFSRTPTRQVKPTPNPLRYPKKLIGSFLLAF